MSSTNHLLRETGELIEKLLRSEIAATEAARLEQLVIDDEACRRLYVRSLRLHAALPQALAWQAEAQTEPAEKAADKVELLQQMPWWRRKRWATAARDLVLRPTPLSLLVAGMFTVSLLLALAALTLPLHRIATNTTAPRIELVAQLVRTQEATWSHSTNLPAGESPRLPVNQTLELTSGFAQLKFDGGAGVLLEGPCKVVLLSSGRLDLLRGKVTAQVPPPAIGFTVETALASFVDLGTEFGVEVDLLQGVSSLVYEGTVQVNFARTNTSKETLELQAGDALRIDPAGNLASNKSVAKKHFVRQLAPPKELDARHLAIARWRFDQFQGDVLPSTSGRAFAGRIQGKLLPADGPPGLPAAAQFSAGSVVIENQPALQVTGPFTLEAWVRMKPMIPTAWDRIVEKNFMRGYVLCAVPHTGGQFGLTPGHVAFGVNNTFAESALPIVDDAWHHLAAVYNGKRLYVYLDGRPGNPVAFSEPVGVSTLPLTIGVSSRDLASEPFTGELAEVAIYARALSPASVRAHHALGRQATTEPEVTVPVFSIQ